MPMAPWEADDQLFREAGAVEAGDAPAAPAPPRNVSGGQWQFVRDERQKYRLAWGNSLSSLLVPVHDFGSSPFGTKPERSRKPTATSSWCRNWRLRKTPR